MRAYQSWEHTSHVVFAWGRLEDLEMDRRPSHRGLPILIVKRDALIQLCSREGAIEFKRGKRIHDNNQILTFFNPASQQKDGALCP